MSLNRFEIKSLHRLATRNDNARFCLVPHQFGGTIRNGVSRRHAYGIRRMDVMAGNRLPLVTNQRRDGGLAVTEIGRQAGERMPQHMRRDIRRQFAQRCNPRKQAGKPAHAVITA